MFGGLSKRSKAGNPCEMFDPDTNTWSGIASKVAPRNVASAVSFKGTIYVLGIFQNAWSIGQRSLYVYNVEKNEWKRCKGFSSEQDKMGCFQICALRMSRDVLKKCERLQILPVPKEIKTPR